MMTFETPVTSIVAISCAAGALFVLLRRRAAVRGTTLIGASSWAVAALAALTAIDLAALQTSEGGATDWSGPLRFAAACLTLCPSVAVLGAKRPQDRAWHWVVLSLWIVLCIPAASAQFFHPGGAVELHAAQSAFLGVLIILGIANYLPTRYAASAVVVTVGQTLLFAEHGPLVPAEWTAHVWQFGIAFYALGIAISPLSRRKTSETESLDAAWRDFRDSFGSFWALRVLTRLNAAAETNRWPVRLAWSGFRSLEPAPNSENTKAAAIPAVHRCLHSLLRRFV